MSYFDKLSGTSFRQKEIDALTGEEQLVLVADPTNEYDEYAVKVEANGVMIGWIRKGNNKEISKALLAGKKVTIDDFTVTGGGQNENGEEINYGVNVKITMPLEENFKKYKKLTPDIGEGFVYFDEENHKYYDENGNQMLSGSKAEEAEVGPADMSYAAAAVSKSTKIPEKKILSLWSTNGDMSRDFGTLVHSALEFYIENQTILQHYDAVREREHTATNWMPNSIGHIVDKYLDIVDVTKSVPEVFVRYGSSCGYIDQLDYIDEKTVVIRDYKIVNELKNVKTKSYGTQKKYTVQQSFYKAILEANGITVDSIILDTYDGDEWMANKIESVDIDVKGEV